MPGKIFNVGIKPHIFYSIKDDVGFNLIFYEIHLIKAN